MTELKTLKNKSPEDLWKEDLAAFSEELEVLPVYCVILFVFSFLSHIVESIVSTIQLF